jgi:hypothetical protein
MCARSAGKVDSKPVRGGGRWPGRGDSNKGDGSEVHAPKKKRGRPRGSKKKSKRSVARPAEPSRPAASAAGGGTFPHAYKPGFIDDEWQDGGVRGRVFIVGLPGSGKSELLYRRVRGCSRVVVFDPVAARTIAQLVEKDGFLRVSQPSELRDLIAENFDGSFRVVYTPTQGDGLKHFESVNAIVRLAGRMVYAVDEVDKYQEPGWAPPELYELLNYGRHVQVAMIGTARRGAQTSKEYTYGLSEICAFSFSEPGDLKYFEGKCGVAVADVIPSLGKYEYIRWMQGSVAPEKGSGW